MSFLFVFKWLLVAASVWVFVAEVIIPLCTEKPMFPHFKIKGKDKVNV